MTFSLVGFFLAVVLASNAEGSAPTTNLIVNPTFSKWSDSTPSGWTVR